MARFENLTLDELDVLRRALSGDRQQVEDVTRTFLLGQVEQQIEVKRENEKLRADAANDADDMPDGQQQNPSSR